MAKKIGLAPSRNSVTRRYPASRYPLTFRHLMLLSERMARLDQLAIAALSGAAFFAVPASPDTVFLANGRSIQGIVTREFPDRIEISLGVGSMTVPRSSVKKVEMASPEQNQAIRNQWKTRYLLHEDYVPAGMENVARLLKAAGDARDAARQAGITHAVDLKHESGLLARLERIKSELIIVSKRMQNASRTSSPAAYNAMVLEYNNLSAAYTVGIHELEEFRTKHPSPAGRFSSYLDSLDALRRAYESALALPDAGQDADRARFLDCVGRIIEDYSRDFSATAVRSERSESGIIVAATVNDSTTGRFLLDTGAAVVTVTEQFARRLNLDTSSLPAIDIVLADGGQASARAVILPSVQVGSARCEHVEAAVMAQQPAPDIDGLLGMSFLRNFAFRIDPSSGQITLTEFTPR
mgnify:CR=1 FL=1